MPVVSTQYVVLDGQHHAIAVVIRTLKGLSSPVHPFVVYPTAVTASPVDDSANSYLSDHRGEYRRTGRKVTIHKPFIAQPMVLDQCFLGGACKLWKSCWRSEME